jgi:hypothetical protein
MGSGVASCSTQKFFHASLRDSMTLPHTSISRSSSTNTSSISQIYSGNPTIPRKKNIVKKLYTLHANTSELQVY